MRNKKIVFLVLLVLVVLLMGNTLSAQQVEVFPIQTSSYWQFEKISQRLSFWQRIGGQVTVYQLPGMQELDRFVPGIAWVISVYYSPFSNRYYVLGGSESANSADTLLVYDGQPGAPKRPLQSFHPLARTGFHPLYVDSRSGFAFFFRPSLSSEKEKKILIFNLANGKLEGEVEATPPQQSYWTAFDEESQRLVFPKVNATADVEGVSIYSTAQRALEKILPVPFNFKVGTPSRSNYDFNGKYIVVPNRNFVLDLEGRSFYDSSKYGWGTDLNVVVDRSSDLAVAFSAVQTTPSSFKSSFVVSDLSLGIPIHRFTGEEARLETGKIVAGMVLQDNILYYFSTGGTFAKITLPPYERFDRELIFPFVRQNETEWTGLAVMSSDANHLASAQIRNRDGDLMPGLINPILLNFAGSPQIAQFPQEWFGNDVLKQTLNNTQTIVIRYNSSRKLKGFGLYGNPDLTFLDGFLALSPDKAGREIVMPISDGSHQDWNSGDRWAAFHITAGTKAEVRSREFELNGSDTNGAGWGERNAFQVASDSFPTAAKRYVRVESSEPLVGVSFIGKPGEDKAGFQAQPVWAKKKKMYFTQNATGFGVWTTEVFLANALEKDKAPQVQVAQLKLFDNDGKLLASATRSIAGNGFLWETTLSLFGLNDVTGYVTAETQGEGLLGWIRFRGWQLSSALPAQESREVVEFSHVAQLLPKGGLPGWGQGVTVLNSTDQTIQVRAEVFKPNGEKTGENIFSLNPGEKRAQHLNEDMFFGPAFEQAGGYVRLTVLTLGGNITADSLYYASNGRVMAAVQGH